MTSHAQPARAPYVDTSTAGVSQGVDGDAVRMCGRVREGRGDVAKLSPPDDHARSGVAPLPCGPTDPFPRRLRLTDAGSRCRRRA